MAGHRPDRFGMISAETVPILSDMTASDLRLLIGLAVWAGRNAYAEGGFKASDQQIRTATGLPRRSLQVARVHLFELGLIDCAAGSGRVPTWYRLRARPRRSDTAERIAEATRQVIHRGAAESAPPDRTPGVHEPAPPRPSDKMLDTRAPGEAQPPTPPASPSEPPPTAPEPDPATPAESQGTAAAQRGRPTPPGPEIVADSSGNHHVRDLGDFIPRCRRRIGLGIPEQLANLSAADINELVWCTGCWARSPDLQERQEEEGR